ncbi:MAG TPA: hypothetical protein VK692_01680, partial [Chthoniobacterales bacterium]|nr:hypothetical protein [Chthoniobacterales bacterium]
ESSSSCLPKKNQCRFFLAVGVGDAFWAEVVDSAWALTGSGRGEEVGLDSSSDLLAEGRALGLGCRDLDAVASGAFAWACLSGEGAALGVGFADGVGLATISIFWRFFKKISRNRFSSSVCWVTP